MIGVAESAYDFSDIVNRVKSRVPCRGEEGYYSCKSCRGEEGYYSYKSLTPLDQLAFLGFHFSSLGTNDVAACKFCGISCKPITSLFPLRPLLLPEVYRNVGITNLTVVLVMMWSPPCVALSLSKSLRKGNVKKERILEGAVVSEILTLEHQPRLPYLETVQGVQVLAAGSQSLPAFPSWIHTSADRAH